MPRGTLKTSLLLMGTLGAARGAQVHPVRPVDLDGIVQSVHTFAEAWFEGDQATMEGCLHPDLVSRVLEAGQREAAPPRLGKASRVMEQLGVPARLGSHTDPGHRRQEVTVLDARGHAASVRVSLGDWVAYIHLVAFNGRWAVVNVLWEWAKPLGA
jgi:hypothetical protein